MALRRVAVRAALVGAVALGTLAFPGMILAHAQAARAHHYPTCVALNRRYPHGVARSVAAANAEVNDGYGRPVVNRSLYRANADHDGNHDGVACER